MVAADADKFWQQHIEKKDVLVKDLEARLEQTNTSAQANAEDAHKEPAKKVSHWVSSKRYPMISPLLRLEEITRC